jgi:hypothetical protein
MTYFVKKFTIRKLFGSKTVVCVFLNPYIGRSGSANMKFFILLFLGDNFGLPGSGSDAPSVIGI